MWKAKIPSKIKAFGWRACQNILPTKMNLFHRKVIEDPTCDECGLGPETVLHVLCQCSKAKEVWKHCNLHNIIEDKGDFQDILWLSGLTNNRDSNLMDMILKIAWGIWKNRNEVRHGGRKLAAAEIYGTASRLREEYVAAQEVSNQPRDNPIDQLRWLPPPHGWYKVNADGAVFLKHKWAGIGVIARDDQGRVVASMSQRLQAPLAALEIEAKAIEAAAMFASDIGIQNVDFESDNLQVCSALQGETEASTTIANIIAGTLFHMHQIRHVEGRHTRREGNNAAHGLAKRAQYMDDFVT